MQEDVVKEKNLFGVLGLATLVYAFIYVFCTFKNPSGIMYPVFIAVTLVYLCVTLWKLEKPFQNNSLFYLISMMLLGVSTFCTDDGRIIVLNKIVILGLTMILLIKQFCNTSEWQLGKHLSSMMQLLFGSLGEIGRPFSDGLRYCKERNKILSKNMAAVLIGIGVAIPLLGIVSMLLATADAVFGELVGSVLDGIRITGTFGNIINMIFRMLVFFVIVYAWLSYLSAGKISNESKPSRKGDPIIAITVTGILTAVYMLFCGIQIVYLFFGNGNLPEGYTYAGYAREGFFQLLAVSVLNLVIVLVSLHGFSGNKVLKIILTMMSLCTFIMIVSSAMRMIMYIRYYFLTFQRVLVLWALIVLFVLFIGVIISIYQGRFRLFRYGVVAITVLYLVFSFSHPDYYIAKINLANTYQEGMEKWEPREGGFFLSGEPYRDYNYLQYMSADAAPVLIPFMAKQGVDVEVFFEENIFASALENNERYHDQYYFLQYLDEMKQASRDDSWRTYNVSRRRMLDVIAEMVEE